MQLARLTAANILHRLAERLVYLFRTLRLVWDAAPSWTLGWSLLLLIQGLLPVAMVYLTKPLVDGLALAIAGGVWERVKPLLGLALAMGLMLLAAEVLQSVASWIRAAQAELIQNQIRGLVHQKSVSIDLAFYESAEYYDQLHRARDESYDRPQALLENLGSLLQNSITLLGMGVVLLPYGLWLPLALLASTVPGLAVLLRYNRRHHQWYLRTTPDRRWASYYDWMLTDGGAAAELRLFGLGAPFQAAYRAVRERLLREQMQLQRGHIWAQLATGSAALLIAGLVMLWMIWRGINGQITLGDMVLFYQVFNRGQSLMRTLLGSLAAIYAHSLFLGNLFAFLDLQPQIVDKPNPTPAPPTLRQGIRFCDVSFCYPGSERVALSDFNLSIPAGKVVAIVGANGAGKSTLVKLLCRFYDPAGGAVEIDGIDLRNLALADLRRMVTVLFQLPLPYHATAGQNIALSDLERSPDAAAIEAAARGAGAHEVIMRLPQSYDTLLGKWFADGTDLSSGEWQRIALARAFLRQSPIVVLDEPTSFMDSWAENKWLDSFRTLVKGRTALIISHRFTTAMRADIIHVMDQGRIVESGSHRELMALGGLYAQSWREQMRASSVAEAIAVSAGINEDGDEVLNDYS